MKWIFLLLQTLLGQLSTFEQSEDVINNKYCLISKFKKNCIFSNAKLVFLNGFL